MGSMVMKVVVVCTVYTLLEFLLPSGSIKKSAAMSLRMTALLCMAGILGEWMG
ncbi:MAG: hypothetical protein Q4E65_01265 [Clostridia bacterium]|nr:hypothetical protein [Clostridia bacterium]